MTRVRLAGARQWQTARLRVIGHASRTGRTRASLCDRAPGKPSLRARSRAGCASPEVPRRAIGQRRRPRWRGPTRATTRLARMPPESRRLYMCRTRRGLIWTNAKGVRPSQKRAEVTLSNARIRPSNSCASTAVGVLACLAPKRSRLGRTSAPCLRVRVHC